MRWRVWRGLWSLVRQQPTRYEAGSFIERLGQSQQQKIKKKDLKLQWFGYSGLMAPRWWLAPNEMLVVGPSSGKKSNKRLKARDLFLNIFKIFNWDIIHHWIQIYPQMIFGASLKSNVNRSYPYMCVCVEPIKWELFLVRNENYKSRSLDYVWII